MTPFLRQVAEMCYKHYADEISDFTFVFQSRRAAKFFQKYLGEVADRPLFSPKLVTVSDFIRQESSLVVADRIYLLLKIYDIYRAALKTDESFDSFAYWGEMLLGDFDDVDKYMVNAKELFANLKDLKEIDARFSYLDENHIKAISAFWNHWKGDKKGEQNFISLWEHLHDIYTVFNEKLRNEGLAYEGMVYRDVAERMRRGETLFESHKKIIFVGLNALTECEYVIYDCLQKMHDVDFYWDYASAETTDANNRASFFRKRNLERFPTRLPLEVEQPLACRNVHIVEMSSTVGQAKYIGEILKTMDMKRISGDLSTAVVLPDEELLLPLLYSLPDGISNVNITMGYPLAKTPLASLLDSVFLLHLNKRPNRGFYYRNAVSVLSHQYVSEQSEEAAKLLESIYKKNMIYIDGVETDDELIKTVFDTAIEQTPAAFIDYLLRILEFMKPMPENNEQYKMRQEFVFHSVLTLKRLKDLLRDTEMSLKTLLRFVRQFVASVSVPFEGEPLKGLQIMGVLETRNLDFDTLIIPCMNEGVFPKISAGNTYVPYNLRYGFGMPTGEHIDSVFAYHFYRLVSRAKNIYFLYNSSAEGLQTGEESRYILQMVYGSDKNTYIMRKRITYDIAKTQPENITVEKTADIMARLADFTTGKRKLSASSISSYLACPLKFYLKEVKNIRESDEVTEELDMANFGNVFHRTMQALYKDCEDKEITADALDRLLQEKDLQTIVQTIKKSFREELKITSTDYQLEGQPLLAFHIVKRLVKVMLEYDKKHAPFVYRASEKKFEDMKITLPSGECVYIKGFIDRVDEKAGKTRIIDYKTGQSKTKLSFGDIAALFDPQNGGERKEVLQMLLYSLYYIEKGIPPENIVQQVVFVQDLLKDGLPDDTNATNLKMQKERLCFDRETSHQYKECLSACVADIFNPQKPFAQTERVNGCSYCDFKAVCERETFELN